MTATRRPAIRPMVRTMDGHARLFCFPYAGGGVSVFHPWSARLAQVGISVLGVQPAGREDRLLEPAFTDMAELTAPLVVELVPYLDRPYAFFGHSMGALIAWEVTHALRDKGMRLPEHVFLSARHGPQRRARADGFTGLERVTDAELTDHLRQLNQTPEEILSNAQFMRYILPTVRADFTLVNQYVYQHDEPLDCATTVFGGVDDPYVPAEQLHDWAEFTRGPFSVQMFPGGHFFLTEQMDALLDSIVARFAPARPEVARDG